MTWLWISGWAVPADWLAKQATEIFPRIRHEAVPADPEGTWRHERVHYDRLIGYSLGAFLLLREERREPSGRPAALLAPFLAFPREANLGGRVAMTRLRYLERWLRRDQSAATTDFYRRAGLDELNGKTEPVSDTDLLRRGIEVLMRETEPAGSGPWFTAFACDNDPLIDSTRLSALLPGLKVIPGQNHHPAPLMRALAGEWPC